MYNIKNAIVTSTFLGREDHGILTKPSKEAFDIYEKLISVKKGGGNDGAIKTGGAMPKVSAQR